MVEALKMYHEKMNMISNILYIVTIHVYVRITSNELVIWYREIDLRNVLPADPGDNGLIRIRKINERSEKVLQIKGLIL